MTRRKLVAYTVWVLVWTAIATLLVIALHVLPYLMGPVYAGILASAATRTLLKEFRRA
jgi:hypothetical protein